MPQLVNDAAVGLSKWSDFRFRQSGVARYIFSFAAFGLLASYAMAAAAPDSPDSRTRAATHLAEAIDMQSRIDDYLVKMTRDLQPGEREKFRALVKKHLRVAVLRDLQIKSLANTFTIRELNALEAFWRTEDGRAILTKYGTYLAAVMPPIDAEIEREIAEIKVEVEKDENPAGTAPHFGVVPESIKIQHEKLRQLLESIQVVETTLQTSQQHLEDTYGNVEVNNVYQALDLSTIDGIHTARQRLVALSAKNDGFAAGLEKERAELEKLVSTNDLAEPEASGLRASLSADEADRFPKYRAWIAAMRAEVVAIGRLVDTAERHLGKLRWQNNRLVASDARAGSDLLTAQQALTDADHQNDQTGRAALDTGNYTAKYILSALRHLEQDMPRHDGT